MAILKKVQSIFSHPVLNSPDFEKVYKNGRIKKQKDELHVRCVEFFAFKGTIFEVLKIFKKEKFIIYEVKTKIYKTDKKLYIDSRFVKDKIKNIVYIFPSKNKIIRRLKKAMGLTYLWGGNIYPKKSKPCVGMDCSGLIFWASKADGEKENSIPTIPRNTKDMIKENFGKIIKIKNLNLERIKKVLKPLDLILYVGHVIIVLDKDHFIESREFKGVIKTPIEKRLKELLKIKRPSNKNEISKEHFLIKRWFK